MRGYKSDISTFPPRATCITLKSCSPVRAKNFTFLLNNYSHPTAHHVAQFAGTCCTSLAGRAAFVLHLNMFPAIWPNLCICFLTCLQRSRCHCVRTAFWGITPAMNLPSIDISEGEFGCLQNHHESRNRYEDSLLSLLFLSRRCCRLGLDIFGTSGILKSILENILKNILRSIWRSIIFQCLADRRRLF